MNHHHTDLIDTTEMYLRTIYELEEEGVVPLRARIAERLGQSGPTVSQTVARMERDGLLQVAEDRHLELSAEGRRHATSVMRKHRLAERLLDDVIGLDWDQLHIEACRWEHVMSDEVERRIVALLKPPMTCPHGNPIPGLDELTPSPVGVAAEPSDAMLDAIGLAGLAEAASNRTRPGYGLSKSTMLSALTAGADAWVTVERISEQLQPDDELMRRLHDIGVLPGRTVIIRTNPDGVELGIGGQTEVLDHFTAEHVFVAPVG
jgi:DtxR family transcriptional regulator, Mn-dependent transcriptional regulator